MDANEKQLETKSNLTESSGTTGWYGFFGGLELTAITLYTFFHFLFGWISYSLFKFSFLTTITIQVVFEVLENSNLGLKIAKTFDQLWGGYNGDSTMNAIIDTLVVIFGYVLAAYIDPNRKHSCELSFWRCTHETRNKTA